MRHDQNVEYDADLSTACEQPCVSYQQYSTDGNHSDEEIENDLQPALYTEEQE